MKTLPEWELIYLKRVSKLSAVLAFVLFAFPAFAKEYPLKLTVKEDNTTGVSLDSSEMINGVPVQVRSEPEAFGFVVVHGRHTNKQLPLLSEGRPIDVNDQGEFQIQVEVKSEHEILSLSTVENTGKIKKFTASLDFPEWEEFSTLVLGRQKPTLNAGFNRIQYEMPLGVWTTSNHNSSKSVYSAYGTTHSLALQGGLKFPKRTDQGIGILGNVTLTYTIPTSGFTLPLSGVVGVKGLYSCLYDSSLLKISPFLGAQYERITFITGLIDSALVNDGHQIKTADFGSISVGAIFYVGSPSHPFEIIPQLSQSILGRYFLAGQNTVGYYSNTTLQLQVRSPVFFKRLYLGTRGQASLLQGDLQTQGWFGYLFLGGQFN